MARVASRGEKEIEYIFEAVKFDMWSTTTHASQGALLFSLQFMYYGLTRKKRLLKTRLMQSTPNFGLYQTVGNMRKS